MIELLKQIESLPQAVPHASPTFSIRRRLLYAVNHSYPFSSNGYAVRTHGVASALVQAAVEVIVVSRPGLPWDRKGFDRPDMPHRHWINGVRYEHRSSPSQIGVTRRTYLEAVVKAMAFYLKVFQPQAVLAASNWEVALPAAIAAREAGIPFFYEVRGFWEISQASKDPAWGDSEGFREAVACETAVAYAAQRVFTINRHMRDELVRRGVEEDRVDLVPNGFAGWPAPVAEGVLSRADLGLRTRYVVGYIGSFNVYEGLEDLIEAAARLRERGMDVAVLLVGSSTKAGGMALGDCPLTAQYRDLANRLNMGEHLLLPGRVAHDQAAAYYALLDLVVIPRRPFAVCEIVSPMKPVEAAAHGKRVLMSDVAPLADLVDLCPNFSLFPKGNVTALANRLGELLVEGDFALPRCEALADLTWDRNVTPIMAALKIC